MPLSMSYGELTRGQHLAAREEKSQAAHDESLLHKAGRPIAALSKPMRGVLEKIFPHTVQDTTGALDPETTMVAWEVAGAISGAMGAYHGYKRHNGSIGWAIGWSFLGGLLPVFTPAIALAQGFGKPLKKK